VALVAMHPIPRSAYIHIPFCRHRCGYCNFTLIAGRDDLMAGYLRALECELKQLGDPHEVDTLFFGGGTPTHLPPNLLVDLLELATRWFVPAFGAEISVEANPLDLTDQRCHVLHEGGVNRLSLGVQSFSDRKLKLLERDHRAGEIHDALIAAKQIVGHGGNVSLDLIFGAPQESEEEWRNDLAQALGNAPTHLSTYGLTFEKGTQFWTRQMKGDLEAISEETERTHYEIAIKTLSKSGFEHYEVSNFARPGQRCRHNEVYWAGKPYFAVGPGAARYVGGRREINHRSTTTWMRRVLAGESPVAESEVLSAEDRARERLVIGLRRMDGVNRSEFEILCGVKIEELVGSELEAILGMGLLEWTGDWLRLTRDGLFVSDSIWSRFLRR
jgi:oxygen-independent coproporphyrinogen-3 oxidase